MPPKGYRHLSVREEVYKRLEEFARSKGLSSIADALVVLLDYADIYSKIEYILQKGVSLPQTGVREAQSDHTTQGSVEDKQHVAKGKRSAFEVLKRQKVTCLSDLARAGKASPEAIIESARREGAVALNLPEDTCVVDPGFWGEFTKRLRSVKSSDDKEVLAALKDSRMKKLYTVLSRVGAVYFDSKRKDWVFDCHYIESSPECPKREEAVEGELEGEELE